MSHVYVATQTRRMAGQGQESRTYLLKQGEVAPEMDSKSLTHALNRGFVQKKSKAPKQAPETKEDGDKGGSK